MELGDLRNALLQRVQNMVREGNPNHPWGGMKDEELLKSARLYQKDYQSGEKGYTGLLDFN